MNKEVKDIIDGFYCKKCKTHKYTCLWYNEQDQLEYHCAKCERRWI